MIVRRTLAFCGLGFGVMMALVYAATHYPDHLAAERPGLPPSADLPAPPALELAPASSSDRTMEFGPAPVFVQAVAMPDPATATVEPTGGARLLLADFQHDARYTEAGLYTRYVIEAVTGAGLSAISRFQISLDPRYQSILIHEAAIIRDGERESREGRIAAEFLRREPELDFGIITGMEVAVLRIEDVRQGDILDLAYSVTGANPLLAPHETRTFPLASLTDVEQLSIRSSWPRNASHRIIGPTGADVTAENRFGRTIYTFGPARTEAVQLEDGAPADHPQLPVLMVSSWPDWASVASWGQAFYRRPAQPDAEIAALAAQFREAHGAPARQLTAALEFVQDEIRYQAVLLGDGTYVPASTSETLRTRTGDCKAKTLLLLSLLDALEIEAYPVLANAAAGRGLGGYPPSPQLFDHVFVQARLDGHVFWLEPAMAGQRGSLFNRSQPDYGQVLVLDGAATGLTSMSPEQRPLASTVYLESFELLDQDVTEPLVWSLEITHRGIAADEWRALIQQTGISQIEQAFTNFYESYRQSAELVSPLQLDDNEEANTLVISASWRVAPLIGPADTTGRREIRLRPHSLGDMLASTDPERNSPVVAAYPYHRRHIIEGGIDGPGGNFWDLENTSVTLANEAFEFSYQTSYENGLLTLIYDQVALTPSVMIDQSMADDHRSMRQHLRPYILWLNLPVLDAQEAEAAASKS
ncbi:hypothetical protein X907_2807 [Glycocaulis alkaliphilus]|uniref:Uncharacterized protein n=1 Tax=Glycocaulis alkaliphilus TaxID=1434191 RepID=A0A3T0EDE1_9PROT|nr:DUF3857 domain-containing protein [Glycocaulis alkaliphilus]AZU05316.1 hypothetical protein X907_2807 [Glycocaulis alkaliphilus]GGB81636.1 hypothetical protein GCM10007417_21960 [Glycocaulis alkaliphilus]